MFIASLLTISACSREPAQAPTVPEKPAPTTPTPAPAQPFVYATLPSEPEWDVKLETPLQVETQEIQSFFMPDAVYAAFPLPEFASGHNQLLMQPGISYGYQMDSSGCNLRLLREVNHIQRQCGLAAGQYAYCALQPAEEEKKWDHQYDPREYAFLLKYMGTYLEVTFPDLETMHVRKLQTPDYRKTTQACLHDAIF